MSDPQRGDIALVTSHRGTSHVAIRTALGWEAGTDYFADNDGVRAVHPLAVIDSENNEQVERLRRLLRARGIGPCDPKVDGQGVRNALREFCAPPKPEQPTGLGAVIEDVHGCTWVLYTHPDNTAPWTDGSTSVEWSEIAAVKVRSEGVPA